jgi:hypothetical protein
LVLGLIALLFIANTINIGANLAAMGAAAELVSVPTHSDQLFRLIPISRSD